MKNAIFFLPNEYADWESPYLSTALNLSEDWTIKTTSIASEIKSIGGFTTKVDYLLDELPDDIDLFILIGGNLWNFDNQLLVSKIKKFLENETTVVGAICGAVDFMARNGLLTGYKHTGNALFLWDDYTEYTSHEDFVEVQARADRNLVTANGSATLEFTELVLKTLDYSFDHEFYSTYTVEKYMDFYKLGYYKFIEKYGNM